MSSKSVKAITCEQFNDRLEWLRSSAGKELAEPYGQPLEQQLDEVKRVAQQLAKHERECRE